ncbi:tetratricopeptide (TPR) repeat protein [Sphingomonas zeicaulis]|uniref:tetratricopeptide repeat protein n=1 Tax=Sphingomonas zeicaulis TaxID=1632740 RepID=UPI003D195292
MGWVILLIFAALVAGLLWWFGRLPKGGLEYVAAALLLGVAGYAWQGHPNLPGSPVQPATPDLGGELMVTAERRALMGQFSGEAQYIDTSEALIRNGSTASAVAIMSAATRKYPQNSDLWVGLGNALVEHGGGAINPAAQYAFQKAATLSPQHPAPPFFFGLALARSGQLDQAATIWRELLERTPPNASWRGDLEKRIAQVDGERGVPAP